MSSEPALGCIGVVDTKSGFYSTAIKWFTETPVSHAFVYAGNGEIVEGEPDGARVSAWDKYGDDAVWLTDMRVTDIDGYRGALLEPTDGQREMVAGYARGCVGRGYNFLDIAVQALASPRLDRIDPDNPPWWARRMADDRRMVCSQLVDACWSWAGLHIFEGRIPGLVSPGALWRAGGSPALP